MKKIDVIGGVYRERCIKPSWDNVFGSGGRAAIALAQMGTHVCLNSYISDELLSDFSYKLASLDKDIITLSTMKLKENILFNYSHGLDPFTPPQINKQKRITLTTENIVVFGMLECDFEVKSNYAVYDPQNTFNTQSFSKSGSNANHLALVLNEYEARALNESKHDDNIISVIDELHEKESAEVIIVKRGAKGAIVSYGHKKYPIPAFKTDSVWKIGSGDCFTAHFANNWIVYNQKPEVAARNASLATAYYCQYSILPSPHTLNNFHPAPINIKETSNKKTIYIASPFFTLPQLWLVEQIRFNLSEMGMNVISPYHDIGIITYGSSKKEFEEISRQDMDAIKRADLIFGVIDGNDAGTLYEVGFATALNKKIILLSENTDTNDLVMFHNEHTEIVNDYVTAIYKALWADI